MSTSEPEANQAVSDRLQQAAAELRELEGLIKSTAIDRGVLEEFRQAVDRARLAAWGIHLHPRATGRRDLT